jgi:PAS domain S-box-containing protein
MADVIRIAHKGGDAAQIIPLPASGGKEKFIAASPLRTIGWVAGADNDELEALTPDRALLPQCVTTLFVMFAALATALGLSLKISNATESLLDHCLAIARGEPREPVDIFDITELNSLARAFNHMAEEIETRQTAGKKAEAALRQSEQRLKAILHTANEGFCLIDNDAVTLDLNPRMCAILGRKREDALGKRLHGFINGESLRVFDEQMKLRAQGKAGSFEIGLSRPDGSVVMCQANSTPLYDQSGNKLGSFSMVSDISERKTAEEALRKSEALFRAIVENGFDGIHFTDENGRITYRSPSWRAFSGYEDCERLGYCSLDLIYPGDLVSVRPAWEDMLAGAGTRRQYQHRLRHKDGALKWVVASAQNFLEDSNIGAVVVTSRDITDRKHAEEALRESEELLRLFVEYAPAALAMFDRKMRYLGFSRRWLSVHNLEEHDLKGLRHYDVVPLIPERWKDAHRRALAGEVLRSESDPFILTDGSLRRLRWEVRPWHNTAGAIAGILIFCEDITESSRQAEELRSLNRALQALSKTFQAMIHAVDEPELLDSVCRIIVEDCGYHMAWIGFAENDEHKSIKPVARAGSGDDYLESVIITWADTELGRGPAGTAIRTGMASVCNDISTAPRMRPWRDESIKRGYASSVSLPLKTGGQTIGVLGIYSREPDFFSEDEVELLANLAENLAFGIADLRLRHALGLSEKNLRESQARLDMALRSAGMGTWHWDIVENKRHYDEQTCFFFGIDPKTFTGQEEEFLRMLDPDNIETFRNALSRTMENDAPYFPEYRMIRPDGELRYLAARGKLVRDETGLPIRMDGLVWDVTETRRAEEQIRAARLMLGNVFDGISDQLLLLDRKGVIQMLNKAAVDYLGLKNAAEAAGRACFAVFYGRSARCEFCEVPIANSAGSLPCTFERRGCREPDRFEQVAIYGLAGEAGELDGVILRITDVTEQKLMQEQLIQSEKLASLGLLVAGIAHEINNPNSFVIFNLPILRDYLDSIMPIIDDHARIHPELEFFGMRYAEFRKDIYDLLKNMEHGSNRISATVATLKSFVHSRNKLELRQVQLKKVIEQSVAICGAEIKKNVKSFAIDICEDVEMIMTDEKALEQILINLLINAAHAADKVDSRINLRVMMQPLRPDRCVLEISDNGCGMDPKTMAKIFDPFFTTKLSVGTGLGLYICKSLLEAMGGRMEVESTPGRGSIFKVILTMGD